MDPSYSELGYSRILLIVNALRGPDYLLTSIDLSPLIVNSGERSPEVHYNRDSL